ncbi:OsmC family protein [Halomarina ordinaria]|uniref:OsmC family protein n=1 Tax=Halomarina ordinaria TaxID=3033939 RepID=A0ABD5U642_9EURY|nr:OsmC family protein [Halomarina sp. PSRA2]
MADISTTSTSEEGYTTVSRAGDYELTIDATGGDGPDPNAVLVADYASCFIPAFRVGGQQEGHDDLGKITVESEADLDDDDDLTAIRFEMHVEADLDDETFDAIVERAEGICHVHSALREELHADIDVHGGQF